LLRTIFLSFCKLSFKQYLVTKVTAPIALSLPRYSFLSNFLLDRLKVYLIESHVCFALFMRLGVIVIDGDAVTTITRDILLPLAESLMVLFVKSSHCFD